MIDQQAKPDAVKQALEPVVLQIAHQKRRMPTEHQRHRHGTVGTYPHIQLHRIVSRERQRHNKKTRGNRSVGKGPGIPEQPLLPGQRRAAVIHQKDIQLIQEGVIHQ